jgi:hypothetical protein
MNEASYIIRTRTSARPKWHRGWQQGLTYRSATGGLRLSRRAIRTPCFRLTRTLTSLMFRLTVEARQRARLPSEKLGSRCQVHKKVWLTAIWFRSPVLIRVGVLKNRRMSRGRMAPVFIFLLLSALYGIHPSRAPSKLQNLWAHSDLWGHHIRSAHCRAGRRVHRARNLRRSSRLCRKSGDWFGRAAPCCSSVYC